MKQTQKSSHFFTKTQLIILFLSVIAAVLTLLIVSWLFNQNPPQTSQSSLQLWDLPLIGFNLLTAWLAIYGAYVVLIVGIGLIVLSRSYSYLKRWALVTMVSGVLLVILRLVIN